MVGWRQGRHAAVVVPVFSLRSERDWGVGEIPTLGVMARWLASAGLRAVHTLPLGDRPAGERSPYSALSAFAIDPVHIGLEGEEDFAECVDSGGHGPVSPDVLAACRGATGIDYDGVRALKRGVLERMFAVFERRHAAGDSVRARAFAAFCAREAGWLDDYVLFRALREVQADRPWREWPDDLRDHEPAACERARVALAPRVRFHAYVQWIGHEQLATAGALARTVGVGIVGDLPFTVGVDSADVWSHQALFDVGSSIGAPPDAFNADGQDWALPAFRWAVAEESGFAWLRARLTHAGRLYDGARLDHVVGYFRTFRRPAEGRPHFDPGDEEGQRRLGGLVLDAVRDGSGPLTAVAEDLGDVPDFVRDAMAARELPGYRILRWERDGDRFRVPREFPSCSVVATGTHDTSSLRAWWADELSSEERAMLVATPGFEAMRAAPPTDDRDLQAGLLDGLYAAGSDVALILVQDLWMGSERINTPATVGPHNWGYRMPVSVERLQGAEGAELAGRLRAIASRHGRAD